MKTAWVISISVAIVLFTAIIAGAIVASSFNGNHRDQVVKLACINHGGTYFDHVCLTPTH